MQQELMQYDVIIVGAGPAGLSAGIRLKQGSPELRVCILEKAASIGGHSLSGAVLDPLSLKELLPDRWQQAPLDTPVIEDQFLFLTKKKAYRLPTPPPFQNTGNSIICLGALCRFLAAEAEALGCEIYPGFAASELRFGDKGELTGVVTGCLGLDKNGIKTENYQPGMHLEARYTLFAEGCRGQLSQVLMQHFKLCDKSQPQSYALDLKEVWKVLPQKHKPGTVIHTVGWPMDAKTYGGSFIYHLSEQRVAVGFVVGLDYKNPWLSPFAELQRFKQHPALVELFEGAERIAYGARALNEGGWQSIPELVFPGGALIGDAAGFLNVARIKGIHGAMKSAMLAAEACIEALQTPKTKVLHQYPQRFQGSWLAAELKQVRNIRPAFHHGLFAGLAYGAFTTYLSRGKEPWTFNYSPDYESLLPIDKAEKIEYPKPDGKISFDRLSSVYLSNTFHAENQPCHLKLKDPRLAISENYTIYGSPETRYCPAAVYEIVEQAGQVKLQINAQNCIHCKSCDIKDPKQNILWQAPEGGGGPNYVDM